MTARILVDTNVVLYSLDPVNPAKQVRAAAWLRAMIAVNSMLVSPQVCGETRVNAQKKLRLEPAFARQAAEGLLPFCTAPLGPDQIAAALRLEGRYGMSWWDALLLASAIAAGCTHVLTEDAQSAQSIDGVRILDPFLTAPEVVLG